MADFTLQDHGSICVLEPRTKEAFEWIDSHLPEDCQFWGCAPVIEPRYVSDIIEGIYSDGLDVQS